MLVLSLLASTWLLVIANLVFRCGRVATGAVLSILLFFLIVCAAPSVLLLQWLLLAGAAFGCFKSNSSVRRFGAYSLCATGLAFLTVGPQLVARSIEVAELQHAYRFESLADRLSYEKQPRQSSPPSVSVSGAGAKDISDAPSPLPSPFVVALENKLTGSPEWKQAAFRERALPELHAAHRGFVHAFIESEGFGLDRSGFRVREIGAGRRDSNNSVILPEPPRIPLPKYEPSPASSELSAQRDLPLVAPEAAPAADEPVVPLFAELHGNGIVDFVNPLGFGYMQTEKRGGDVVKDLDRVVGFQSHAFRALPQVPVQQGVHWRIEMLQLMSLLKHPAPVAYLSENLPRMDELRDASTRELDDFERRALNRLEAGEDVIVADGRHAIRMLGSIRALKQCVQCHHVERGTLLGAFSYRLARDPRLPDQAPNKPLSRVIQPGRTILLSNAAP